MNDISAAEYFKNIRDNFKIDPSQNSVMEYGYALQLYHFIKEIGFIDAPNDRYPFPDFILSNERIALYMGWEYNIASLAKNKLEELTVIRLSKKFDDNGELITVYNSQKNKY